MIEAINGIGNNMSIVLIKSPKYEERVMLLYRNKNTPMVVSYEYY